MNKKLFMLQEEKKEEDCDKCTCDYSYDEHPCPYQQDVNNDSSYSCTCCSHCTNECAMDI